MRTDKQGQENAAEAECTAGNENAVQKNRTAGTVQAAVTENAAEVKAKKACSPVGVFDSGVGGISVLRSLVDLMPGEDFYFFGDSANAPYGTRPEEEIRRLTLAHAQRMVQNGVKALVIACNTATSAAIAALRERYPDMPVIGIEPALKPAVLSAMHPRVIVMATPGTVSGEKFRKLLSTYRSQGDILPLACPGLMEYVEQGILEGPELDGYLEKLLSPLLEIKTDAIVLGCTHYPFVRESIRKIAGDDVRILDGSEGTAHQLQRRIEEEGLSNPRRSGGRVIIEMSLPEKEGLARALLTGR